MDEQTLAAIRRDCERGNRDMAPAARALLREVDRLRAELDQTKRTLAGYREQVRCLELGADEW